MNRGTKAAHGFQYGHGESMLRSLIRVRGVIDRIHNILFTVRLRNIALEIRRFPRKPHCRASPNCAGGIFNGVIATAGYPATVSFDSVLDGIGSR